ncbi:MAG: hypothetical protein INR69_01120 [Mucilaginibacter polytrichastri]|nr:hypothetical protein [Mucilaginibacter polytrichastri]
MLEQTEILLSAEFLQQSAGTAATEGITRELERHNKALHDLLSGYYFMERKRVMDVQIDTGSVALDGDGKGSFQVTYTLGLFNACADIDHQEKAQMTIRIDADFTHKKAVLTGEYFPEREPDEL